MRSHVSVCVLLLLCFLLLPVTLFAAGGAETKATGESPTATVAAGKYREAPMLAARVRKGELPPVEQRMPKEPLVWNYPDVLQHEDGIGKYGGTVRLPNWRGGPHSISTCLLPESKQIEAAMFPTSPRAGSSLRTTRASPFT